MPKMKPLPGLPRLYALDGLRGMCAIAIMLYHYIMWSGGAHYFQIGHFGVYFFFVISGFSLWYVYKPRGVTPYTLKAFFIARIARIFPLYLFANVMMMLLRAYNGGIESVASVSGFNTLFLNITFLFGYILPLKTGGVVGGWTIGIEWMFYIICPLLLLFVRTVKHIAFLLSISIMLNQLYVGSLISVNQLRSFEYIVFPVFLAYFFAGVLAAEVYNHLKTRNHKLFEARFSAPLKLLALIGIAGVFLYPARNHAEYLYGLHFPFLILAMFAAVLLLSCSAVTSLREQKLYGFLGDISYGTYLLHYIVYICVTKISGKLFGELNPYILITTASLLSVAAAFIVYRRYEMPARDWINRMGKANANKAEECG